MTRRAISAISILAGIAFGTSAFAGGPLVVAQEPAVYAPVAVAVNGDWTGGYVGGAFGNHKAKLSGGGESASDDDTGFGIFGGYNHDFGQYVLGGELSFDRASKGGVDVELTRLKGRAGYDAGNWMPYATLGLARVEADVLGYSASKSGVTFGIGADFKITNNFILGAELTRSQFSNFVVDGLDADIDTIQIRAAYKF